MAWFQSKNPHTHLVFRTPTLLPVYERLVLFSDDPKTEGQTSRTQTQVIVTFSNYKGISNNSDGSISDGSQSDGTKSDGFTVGR